MDLLIIQRALPSRVPNSSWCKIIKTSSDNLAAPINMGWLSIEHIPKKPIPKEGMVIANGGEVEEFSRQTVLMRDTKGEVLRSEKGTPMFTYRCIHKPSDSKG